jgi:hypothetical protein
MKVDGACLCGTIRYEAEIDPAAVMSATAAIAR